MKRRLLIGIYDSGGIFTIHLSKEKENGGFEPMKMLTLEPEASICAVQKKGHRLGGSALLQLGAEELLTYETVLTDIKALPGTGNDEGMISFAEIIYEEVREKTYGFYGREPVWVIGFPSNWLIRDIEAKERYIALLQRAGMERVILCEEAVAALVYYRKALQVVTEENRSKGVLCLNWDAQTLSYTFFHPSYNKEEGDKKIETGSCALGTRLIYQAIVYAALYRPEEYGLAERNDITLTQKIRTWYEKDKRFQRWMYAHAGKLTETYFQAMAQPGLKPRRTQLKWEERIDCGEEGTFSLALSIAMMEDLLSKPLKEMVPDFKNEPESVREDLGEDSFLWRSERFLEEVSTRYPAYVDAQDTLLILTGSVSQTELMLRAVETYLPNRKIDYDHCPELSIGRGLVYYGQEMSDQMEMNQDARMECEQIEDVVSRERTDIRSFEEEFDRIAADMTGEKLKSFCESFVQDMVKEVVAYLEHYRRSSGRGRYSNGIGAMREWQSNDFHTLRAQYSERLTEWWNEAYKDLLHQYGYQQPLFGEGENWLEMYREFFMQVCDDVARGENSFFGTQNRIYACVASEGMKWLLERRYLECKQTAEQRLQERKREILRNI